MRRAVISLALAVLPAIGHAQDTQRCSWSTDRQANVQTPSGNYNTFFGGSVVMRCPAKELTLTSDSLESYADEGRVFVIGNVHYKEPRFIVDSDFLTYFQLDERIVAQGNVRASMPNGSTMVGPTAEYQRITPTRPVPRLIATGRPTINVVQKDSTGADMPPLVVVANTVTMVGDSLVYGGGSVVATREDLVATGDSMALDGEREVLRMMRGPVIQGKAQRPFTLSGTVVVALSHQRKLQRVIARGTAKAVSEEMTLASDTIDLAVTDNLLERAQAWGKSRANASSPTQHIVADSIDVLMPAQRLREMHALRGAVAESRPDSTRFKPDTVDWLHGDTIIALFDSASVRDTSHSPQIQRLLARGDAKSFYQMPPADTSEHRPAINYVVGNEIIVDFASQQVARVTVYEQKGGVYLEPKRVAAADSTAATPEAPGTRPAAPRPGIPGLVPRRPGTTGARPPR